MFNLFIFLINKIVLRETTFHELFKHFETWLFIVLYLRALFYHSFSTVIYKFTSYSLKLYSEYFLKIIINWYWIFWAYTVRYKRDSQRNCMNGGGGAQINKRTFFCPRTTPLCFKFDIFELEYEGLIIFKYIGIYIWYLLLDICRINILRTIEHRFFQVSSNLFLFTRSLRYSSCLKDHNIFMMYNNIYIIKPNVKIQ